MAQPEFVVGEVSGRIVVAGGWDHDLGFLFPDVPEPEVLSAVGDRLEPGGTLHLPYDCVLLTTPEHAVLVDSGGGGTGLLSALAAIGFRPEDIDVVLVTHAHPDHIGGLVVDGHPVFADARHVLTTTEWTTWTSEEVLAGLPDFLTAPARAVLPHLERAGVVDLLAPDAEVVPGVQLLPAPGHTPGHTAVAIRSADEEVLLLADAVLDDSGFAHPDWTSVPDMDPEQTVATRLRLLDALAADGGRMLAYHVPGIGIVERTADGFRFTR